MLLLGSAVNAYIYHQNSIDKLLTYKSAHLYNIGVVIIKHARVCIIVTRSLGSRRHHRDVISGLFVVGHADGLAPLVNHVLLLGH